MNQRSDLIPKCVSTTEAVARYHLLPIKTSKGPVVLSPPPKNKLKFKYIYDSRKHIFQMAKVTPKPKCTLPGAKTHRITDHTI